MLSNFLLWIVSNICNLKKLYIDLVIFMLKYIIMKNNPKNLPAQFVDVRQRDGFLHKEWKEKAIKKK